MLNYEPNRKPNEAYRDVLRQVMLHGQSTLSAHEDSSHGFLVPKVMRFDILRDGVPLITERSFKGIYKSSIGELLAFINGARTLDELRKFGVNDKFWAPWVTEEKCSKRGLPAGDLGDGSYGAVFHDFPTPEGPFNQVAAVVRQIKERPNDRSHRISNWYLPYLTRGEGIRQRTVVTPCHGDMYFRVINKRLNLVMTQHKADIVTGVPNNMIQYAAFLIAMAHVTGYEVGEYVHILVDAHYYKMTGRFGTNEITPDEAIKTMLGREPRYLPTLQLTADAPKEDIFAFRTEHFILDDYHPHDPIMNIITSN